MQFQANTGYLSKLNTFCFLLLEMMNFEEFLSSGVFTMTVDK